MRYIFTVLIGIFLSSCFNVNENTPPENIDNIIESIKEYHYIDGDLPGKSSFLLNHPNGSIYMFSTVFNNDTTTVFYLINKNNNVLRMYSAEDLAGEIANLYMVEMRNTLTKEETKQYLNIRASSSFLIDPDSAYYLVTGKRFNSCYEFDLKNNSYQY